LILPCFVASFHDISHYPSGFQIRSLPLLILFLFPLCAGIAADSPPSVRAVRVQVPPHIDGRLNDPVWNLATPATGFRQRQPLDGEPASERTEIRVLYDAAALYFGCMYVDSEPGKIVARLARRDDEDETDTGSIRIDSFHDSRNAFEFTFNPAGVKVDILQFEDGNREDASWDPVWELETQISAEGWSAEIRIPFSVLRYKTSEGDADAQIWGINFTRFIHRKQESDRWSYSPLSSDGFVSRFGHLEGLDSLPSPRRIEMMPFGLARQGWVPATESHDRIAQFSADGGVDMKIGISNSVILDATINPDFNEQSFNMNLVVRWEYLPGSTLFLVWSQARAGESTEYFTSLGHDIAETFRLPPSNVTMVKATIWWNL